MLTDAGLDCVFSAGEGGIASFFFFFFFLCPRGKQKLTHPLFRSPPKKNKKTGAMHCLHEKPVEVKRAVPREQMATAAAAQAQAAAAATVRAAAASAPASAPRNRWEPPASSSNGNGDGGFRAPPPYSSLPRHDADFYGGGVLSGGGPGFAGGGSLAAELEALSFHGGGGGDDFFRRPRSPYGGGGNAPFDRSAFEDGEGAEREAAATTPADDSGLVAFLARQQQPSSGNAPSAALRFEKLREAPAPSSTHSLSPPEGGYKSLYNSDVFGPPSASAVAGFPSSEADGSGGEGGGRNSSGEHPRDEERYGRGFEFFPAAASSSVAAAAADPPRSPYSDSLGAAFGFGDGNGKAGEW